MNTKKLFIVLSAILIIIGFLIFNYFKKEPIEMIDQPEAEEIEKIVLANNQFALDFYLKNKEKENIFFSPYGLSTVLAIIYEGARGKTAQEIESVFYFSKKEFNRSAILNLQKRKELVSQFELTNSIWFQKDLFISEEYFNVISRHYKTIIEKTDFISKPEQSREKINKSVESQTKGKIKEFIPEGIINSLTRLILTNSIFFKGEWSQEFNKTNTTRDSFYLFPNESVKIEMMQRLDEKAEFFYYATEDFQILEIPYSGEEISMLVLLPKESLKEIESQLTVKNLNLWQKNLTKQRVKVFFPKFKFESKYFLKSVLSEMGMPTAFSQFADFSEISEEAELSINEIIHQAVIEVNEKGTKAVTATGIVMELISIPEENIPVFRADRPFIFLIQEKETGVILFIGNLVNPEN